MSNLPNKPAEAAAIQAADSILRSLRSTAIKSTAVPAAPLTAQAGPTGPAPGPDDVNGARPDVWALLIDQPSDASHQGAGAREPGEIVVPAVAGISSLKSGVMLSMRDVVLRDGEAIAQRDAIQDGLRSLIKMSQRSHELVDDLRKETARSFGSVFSNLYEDFVRLDDRVVPLLLRIADDLTALASREADLADRLQVDFTTAINGLSNTLYPSMGSLDHAIRTVGICVNDLTQTIQDGHAAILDSIPAPVYPTVSTEPDRVLEAIQDVQRDSNETLELVMAAHALVDSLRDELTRAGIIGGAQPRRSSRISAAARDQSAPYQPAKLRKTRARTARGCKETARRTVEIDELNSTDEERGLGGAAIAVGS